MTDEMTEGPKVRVSALEHSGLFATRPPFAPLAGASTRGEDVPSRSPRTRARTLA